MATVMKNLKIERKITRSMLTKLCNKIREEDTPLSKGDKNKLLELNGVLEELNTKIKLLMFEEECTEEAIEEEVTKAFEYKEKIITVLADTEKDTPEKVSEVSRVISLPKLEVKKFDLSPKTWIQFWAQHTVIHEDSRLNGETKFQYLIQSLEMGSKAARLIESFPPSKENYEKALDSLKNRFGREELLIDVYVKELLALVLKPISDLGNLYDKLNSQLRALETLGLTTDRYAFILAPLVESCLPIDVLKRYERQKLSDVPPTRPSSPTLSEISFKIPLDNNPLESLLSFLEKEVQGDERAEMARTSFQSSSGPSTTSALLTQESKPRNNSCFFCLRDHPVERCFLAQRMTLDQRKEKVLEKKACWRCLKGGHFASQCRTRTFCLLCGKSHLVIMCPKVPDSENKKEEGNETLKEDNIALFSNLQENNKVYLQTLKAVAVVPGTSLSVRVVLDSGAQNSYIRSDCIRNLNLVPTGSVKLTHGLFGGHVTKEERYDIFQVPLQSKCADSKITLDLLARETICGPVNPVQDLDLILELAKKGITLTDTDSDSRIDILLGADSIANILTCEVVPTQQGPLAVKTVLGWTLLGRKSAAAVQANFSLSLFTIETQLPSIWELESIGISAPEEHRPKTQVQEEVYYNILSNITMDTQGRYQVKLPWKIDAPSLPDNRALALKRVELTSKRLKEQNVFQEYNQVLLDWLVAGIIEKVPDGDTTIEAHYLPHRPVVKEGSSTKIRPVFDASAQQDGVSLNSCLNPGPNLVSRIPDILTRFRMGNIGVSSDIKKAFLQIGLHPEDRDYTRFFWWNDGELVEFRHCRVIFGLCCSPCHLSAVINNHLQGLQSSNPECSQKLKDSFYVDNVLTAVDNLAEYESFKQQATEMMAHGKFELTQWRRNSTVEEEVSNQGVISALGIMWDLDLDTFYCQIPTVKVNDESTFTKRNILSITSSVFDVLGFWCPVLICPKRLLQETWKRKLTWDEELPDDIKQVFLSWIQFFPMLTQCRIPRLLCSKNGSELKEVHIFCDASSSAYAACAFMRIFSPGEIKVKLVQACSRIAPINRLSIPRLELMAATIATRLYNKLKIALKMNDISVTFWSDSMVTLTWITCEGSWTTFVKNRVKEIRSFTEIEQWRFVPGTMNPADLPSRGCNAKQLLESKWWEGPDWLYLPSNNWPQFQITETEEAKIERKKESSTLVVTNEDPDPLGLTRYFSSYSRIVRMVAWMLRFKHKSSGNLSSNEICDAEKIVIKYIQRNSIHSMNYKDLQTELDPEGLLRVKTRVCVDRENYDFIRPFLLPKSHPLVNRLIEEQHKILKHAGVLMMITNLRQSFWILQARRAVRSIVSKCLSCKRLKAKPLDVPFSDLPWERTHSQYPFQHTGADLAGPLYLKDGSKAWLVIFTCAVFRAVHLELVQSLSTDAFLLALRRFLARRGRIQIMYTDNGTNFKGTENYLKTLDWKRIEEESGTRRIIWKFNPPLAAWWGGFWERLIRIIKFMLKASVEKAYLDYVELYTVLCDIESTMNMRPLTYVADDHLKILTPADFIFSLPQTSNADLDELDSRELNKRAFHLQQVRVSLRKRFKEEYLSALSCRCSRNVKPIQVGEVVLIQNDETKRNEWPLGIITELMEGRDGHWRVAKVKTKTGFLVRPLQRLIPLEITQNTIETEPELEQCASKTTRSGQRLIPFEITQNIIETEPELEQCASKTTRSGRTVKKIKKLDL